jgi:hypothetical protein
MFGRYAWHIKVIAAGVQGLLHISVHNTECQFWVPVVSVICSKHMRSCTSYANFDILFIRDPGYCCVLITLLFT